MSVPSVGRDPTPYIRSQDSQKYVSAPQWSSYEELTSQLPVEGGGLGPTMIMFESKFMDDILVHKKINNALTYPLLTKDILLNIEFKEPRIFYKEMLHSSLNPRLLYMHVMKETGLPINYNNLHI